MTFQLPDPESSADWKDHAQRLNQALSLFLEKTVDLTPYDDALDSLSLQVGALTSQLGDVDMALNGLLSVYGRFPTLTAFDHTTNPPVETDVRHPYGATATAGGTTGVWYPMLQVTGAGLLVYAAGYANSTHNFQRQFRITVDGELLATQTFITSTVGTGEIICGSLPDGTGYGVGIAFNDSLLIEAMSNGSGGTPLGLSYILQELELPDVGA